MAIVDFAELKALVPDGRLMALDVGSKTIGVAASDTLRMLATPITTLKRGKLAADLALLAELAKKHEIKALAIGLPLNMDGTEGPRCQSVRQFAANIASHGPPALANLPVVWQDERLSTAAVTRGMIDDYDMTRAKRAERVDAAAAAWILESALARGPPGPPLTLCWRTRS
jgi:putative Holliday junction resolvase